MMNGRVRLMDIVMLTLIVLCFTALAFGQKSTRDTADNLAHTNQNLCELLSASREASNAQLRVPLRDTMDIVATVLEFAAANPNTPPAIRRGYSANAARLRQEHDDVKIVQPFPCLFEGDDK